MTVRKKKFDHGKTERGRNLFFLPFIKYTTVENKHELSTKQAEY